VSSWWQVLVLHYLSVTTQPAVQPPAIAFADLPGGRTYGRVYQQRVVSRLCGTVGRSRDALLGAAGRLCGRVLRDTAGGISAGAVPPAGDVVIDFDVFERLAVRLVWYAPDEEFPPSAVLLLPANIERFFCIEDIVVLSERLIARLGGGRF